MIFFSNNILNKIIDHSELDEITDKVEEFTNDNIMIFTYFNYGIINIDYIENLLNYESNKIAYYCFDNEFNIRNCPSCMIYSKQYDENTDEITYYILLISTQKRFRNMGYGTLLLDGFMNKISEEEKSEINLKVDKLREAHTKKEISEVKTLMEEVNKTFQEVSQKLYEQTTPNDEITEEDFQNVEFEEVK